MLQFMGVGELVGVDLARSRRGLVLIGLVGAMLIGLFGAGSAEARGWIPAVNISPQIASDNERYVAFQRRNRVPTVMDTWTGSFRMIEKAWRCQPRAIGAGRVLLICPHTRSEGKDTGFRAKTASVKGGPAKDLAHGRKVYDAYGIGRFWIPIEGDGPVFYAYLNWRTGGIKRLSYKAKSGIDLDRRRIRWADVKRFTPNFKGYPNPFWSDPELCRGEDVVISDWKDELRLWFDPDRSVRLGRGGFLETGCKWYGSMRIGTPWVTWKKRNSLHGYNFRTGQRFDRGFPSGSKITPVRDGVVVTEEISRINKFYKTYRVKFFRFG